jgi:ArsR family transcriptional regulator
MKMARAIPVEHDQAASMIEHLAALADPLRCRILLALERHELTVTELCAVTQLPQSTVSRHLKTLADDGWVTSRREGASRYYGMDLQSLDPGARRLWPLTRDQVAGTLSAEQDERRLAGVLARRRAKAEQFFSSAAGEWDRLRQELFGQLFHLHALLALLDRSLVVGDLGCGTGQVSELVAPYVARVVGVDASTEMLAAAERRLTDTANVELRHGELEALPLSAGELDAAILALVLNHVAEPPIVLSEVARVLRPGGRILIVDLLPHDHQEYQQQMGHLWLGFPEGQILKLLDTAGFDDVRVRALPVEPGAKGPSLFAAVAAKRARLSKHDSDSRPGSTE